MKYILVSILFFLAGPVQALQPTDQDQAARELAEAMGINDLLKGVMDQTRDGVNASMAKLAQRIAAKYPNMTDEQNTELRDIFAEYTDAIISSIDTDKAAYIYMSVIVEKLSDDDIEGAKEFYQSESGQKTMEVVASAARKMNEYVMQQMAGIQESATHRLSLRIQNWQAQISAE